MTLKRKKELLINLSQVSFSKKFEEYAKLVEEGLVVVSGDRVFLSRAGQKQRLFFSKTNL